MFIIDIVEILEIFATSLLLGYLFSHLIRAPARGLKYYVTANRFWNWEDVKYSMMVVGPAIVLHEFGHKIAAIALGFPSRFHGILTGGGLVWIGAVIGFIMRLASLPCIFLITGYVAPAYVGAWAGISAGQTSFIAFMGPAVNLVLCGVFFVLLKSDRWPRYARFFHISMIINGFLFVLNMLPFGPLDGAKVFGGLKTVLFG